MAEEEVGAVGVASPSPLDHKRKFEDLEPEVLESSQTSLLATTDLNVEPDVVEDAVVLSSDESELKRPRLDDKSRAAVNENGRRKENDETPPTLKDAQPVSEEIETATIEQPSVNDEQPNVPNVNEETPNVNDEQLMENNEQPAVNDGQSAMKDEQPAMKDEQPAMNDAQPVSEEIETATIEQPSVNDEQPNVPNVNEETTNVNDEQLVENNEQPAVNDGQSAMKDEQPAMKDEQPAMNDEQPVMSDEQPAVDNSAACDTDTQHPSVENFEVETLNESSKEETQLPFMEDEAPTSDIPSQSMTHKMDVPNNKVGVLIGKAGDTIRYLQYNSGAKIQIMRDAEADSYSTSRPVQIIGSLENIKKAEKLINAVIAEADAGGSPSLVARGLAPSQVKSAAEQIQLQVPNEKVGLIIGRGGETIKSLQTRSGARIQLIPQVLPEGEECKERTVRITGDKMQIDIATEMIKEVMSQTVRPSPFSSGSNQQVYRPRGSGGPTHWGPRGPHRSQPTAYDYPQRGAYPSSSPQYPHHGYRNYPPQMGSRSNYGPGWEPRPQPTMQGPPSHGAYNYYGGRGHISDGPVQSQHPNPVHTSGPGPGMSAPHVQPNYNYAQQHGPDYGHHAQYSQPAPHQGYGHGYNGGHGSQPVYPQAASHTGYPGQQQYDKQASYGMPSQGQPQPYAAPRASQPGEMPYQGATTGQSFGPNAQPQPTYPYPASGSSQQMYPPYGTAPASDGYSQAPLVASGSYPQQGAQAGYGQPVAQQAPAYSQVGASGGYGQYPSSQQAYPEQQAPNPATYGYQAPQDVAYTGGAATATYSAVPSGQSGYSQQTAAQPSYDQSAPSSGGYGSVPASAQAGYGKTVSPQPAGYAQYDSTQV